MLIAGKRECIESDIPWFNTARMEFVGCVFDDTDDSFSLKAVESNTKEDADEMDANVFGGSADDGTGNTDSPALFTKYIPILLPSTIGHKKYLAYDLQSLLEEEIQLWCSQANDALHKSHLALVDRAIMLRTDVQHAKSQAMTTKAWLKVTNVQNAVQ